MAWNYAEFDAIADGVIMVHFNFGMDPPVGEGGEDLYALMRAHQPKVSAFIFSMQ